MPNADLKVTSPQMKSESVELGERRLAEVKLPLHEDVMQLARLGELAPIQKLYDEGTIKADLKDDEGITPLHWAAINNHYAVCKYFIDQGVDVNAKGGEAVATAAMWAAQRCNYYIADLLLRSGADPLLTDAQGYNILHLATFDGNVFLLVLLLHQNIPIDSPDPQGHTCLMWAAYKGYPACVELFLRWGASVDATDENGFTALHWATVKGSQMCIQKLIEYGSDRFAETSEKKTPEIIATEMKSTRNWHQALSDCGYDDDANPKQLPIPFGATIKQRVFLDRLLFLQPFATIFLVLFLLSNLPVFVGVPLTVFLVYTLQWASTQLLTWAPPDMRHIHQTPYLAGVFAATLFWVGMRWLLMILPNTYATSPFTNLVFAATYGLCSYFYILSMTEDPGYVPKLGSRRQQKAAIDELLSSWKFDDQNFCVQCMVRRPLRSKHCKRCKRCVAKHDHHCPWVYNCVGANNLRHFYLYILAMEVGIILFIRLVLDHLDNLPIPTETTCNILKEYICSLILRDLFTVLLTIWAALQLTWVTMLLIVQTVQISRAITTFENMRGHDHQSSHAAEVFTAGVTAGSTSMDGAQLLPGGAGPSAHGAHAGHHHAHKSGCFAQWKKLLGLDTFVATAQGGLTGRSNMRRRNPFSRGIVTNCKDFWLDPAPYFGKRELGAGMLGGEVINYTRMYETPFRMSVPSSSGRAALGASITGEESRPLQDAVDDYVV